MKRWSVFKCMSCGRISDFTLNHNNIDEKSTYQCISCNGELIDICKQMNQKETSDVSTMFYRQYRNRRLTFEEIEELAHLAKSEKKEEVVNKYLVMADGVFAEVNGIDNAKIKAEQFAIETNDEVRIYELKMTASVVKPKVEFKEI